MAFRASSRLAMSLRPAGRLLGGGAHPPHWAKFYQYDFPISFSRTKLDCTCSLVETPARLDALRKFWTPTGAYWTEVPNEQGFKYFVAFAGIGMVLWYKLAKWVEPNIVRYTRMANCNSQPHLALIFSRATL